MDLSEDQIIEQRRAKRRKLQEELEKSNANKDQTREDGLENGQESAMNDEPIGQKINGSVVVNSISNDETHETDDSDDMFADEVKEIIQENGIQNGQELAANMLDDWDDQEGYYRVIVGELLNGQYKVTEFLGKGVFASVVRAKGMDLNDVAIKVIRNNESMMKEAYKEIDILRSLNAEGKYIIRLKSTFEHKGHLCLVFENMEENLRDSLKKLGRKEGFSLETVRKFTYQSFKGLQQLEKCHIIHGDIKPDNMLINKSKDSVKIADLGSAQVLTDEDELISREPAPYMASRFYRAPELILGLMPYGYGVDMWSLGCTLYEIYTGEVLFSGSNNNDMLRVIMDIRGNFSRKLLSRSTLSGENFTEEYEFLRPHLDKVTGRSSVRPVKIPISPPDPLRNKLKTYGNKMNELWSDLDDFADILDKMLALNPDKRLTASKGLEHAFITRTKTAQ